MRLLRLACVSVLVSGAGVAACLCRPCACPERGPTPVRTEPPHGSSAPETAPTARDLIRELGVESSTCVKGANCTLMRKM